MSRTPFQIIPWQDDFLAALAALVLARTDGRPGRAVIVFPHDRPKRYLTRLFARGGHPQILPRLFTVRECFAALDAALDGGAPQREAGALDKVALLWDVLHAAGEDAAQDTGELRRLLSGMDEAAFFPWGVRLAALLDECLDNGLSPAALAHTGGEVAPFAAALLGALGDIFTRYRARLVAHGLGSPALAAARVAEAVRQGRPLPAFMRDRAVFLAGFAALNGTEETLFHALWEAGGTVCLHGDPLLADTPARAHHACAPLARWIRKWNAPCALLTAGGRPSATSPASSPAPAPGPRIQFFAGHDLHSQLGALGADLAALPPDPDEDGAGRAAIALTHPEALLPVLHQLPDKDCNVSLGYPLQRTLLARLLEAVLTLRDTRRADGRVHWRALLEVLRHPGLRMLRVQGVPLRDTLTRMETQLRAGQPFVDADQLLALALAQEGADLAAAAPVRLVLDLVLRAFAAADTPAALARCLEGLCGLLLDGGGELWNRFPLDAEGMFRLNQRVIPALSGNLLAGRALPWPLLRAILDELIQEERVPFEADPLTGVQVLGMLETRLLRFRHVFMVDVTEDRLPGAPAENPLLPDTLRAALGLPDALQRDELAAYTFFRLISGARDVCLYWQEGIAAGRLFDGRKRRSRFIEELIWQEEQRRGDMLTPGRPPLRVADTRLLPPRRPSPDIVRTPALRAAMDALLAKPLSPTELDVYLACPLRFYYERLCRLTPLREVQEGDDPAGVGQLLHRALCTAYTPWLGKRVDRAALDARLADCFARELAASALQETLPPESLAMLRLAGPERLRRFAAAQPDTVDIVALETQLTAGLPVRGVTRQLRGFADRIDRRLVDGAERVLILDYKTGKPRVSGKTFWTDEALWADLLEAAGTGTAGAGATAFGGADEAFAPDALLLPRLAAGLPSIQLAMYLYMLRQSTGAGDNAAFVDLGGDGGERFLLPPALPEDLRQETLCVRIPALLRVLLLHMERCPVFYACPGRQCGWCPSARFCGQGNA